ncbi:ATP-binding cassette domain-containing protein [Chitinimonas sp.]|uniref:ATP-binding cassette domain-containing protein n=1 Tax=Chitinimonas sp. TaxID=1934313 RepID=UPI002F94F97C
MSEFYVPLFEASLSRHEPALGDARLPTPTPPPAAFAPGGSPLVADRLVRQFGEQRVLDGLSVSIPAGQFVAVVGRSGCGKSTFLRLAAGLDKPTRGGITLEGAGSDDIRVMFQDARLLPWRSVLDNVALGLPPSRHAEALAALREVGLADRAHHWPSVLSGGQRQRVALARALVHRPRLLLLDEPLGALDALTRIDMQRLIERVWRDHQFTVLLVTHDVAEAVALADRVLLIEEGKIGLDLKLHLARPRARGSAAFAEYEAAILERVLGQAEQAGGPAHEWPQGDRPAAQLQWAL